MYDSKQCVGTLLPFGPWNDVSRYVDIRYVLVQYSTGTADQSISNPSISFNTVPI